MRTNISFLVKRFICYIKFYLEHLLYVKCDPPETNMENKSITLCLEKSICLYVQGTPEWLQELMQAKGLQVPTGAIRTWLHQHDNNTKNNLEYYVISKLWTITTSLFTHLFWKKYSSLKS